MDVRRWLRTQWDRVAAWVLIAVGALALVLGWAGASNTPFPAEQIPYVLSGGIGGALLVGLGAALLLSADARDEWQKLDRIERLLARGGKDETSVDVPATAPAPVAAADDTSNGTAEVTRARQGRRRTAGKGSRP
jgi:hypothetical protein